MAPRASATSVRRYWETEIPALGRLEGIDVCDGDGEKALGVEGSCRDRERAENFDCLSVRTGWFGVKRDIVPRDDVAWSKTGDPDVTDGGERMRRGVQGHEW